MIEADQQITSREVELRKPATSSGAFFWLCAFYFIYCARPEDWDPCPRVHSPCQDHRRVCSGIAEQPGQDAAQIPEISPGSQAIYSL